MKNGKLNLAICISGGGTTMREVIRATKDGRLPHVNPALIISSELEAGGIEKARAEGVSDIKILPRKDFTNRDAFGEVILHECRERDIDLIAQCGFLPIMPKNVTAEYRDRILNQHPGPVDKHRLGFGGRGMHGRAVHHAVLYFASYVCRPFRTEATVHRVTDVVDGGALLGVQPVEIMPGDDASKLAERVLPHEHQLVIRTIMQFSEFGGPNEIYREHPLIRPGEEELLANAKAYGIEKYPEG